MANNVTFESSVPATPPPGTIVETIDQGVGLQRQVIEVGSIRAGVAVAVSSATVTPSSVVSITPSSVVAVSLSGIPAVALSTTVTNIVAVSSGVISLSSAIQVTLTSNTVILSSNPTVIPSSVVSVSLSSVPTVTLSSNPTVIPSSAIQVTLTSNTVAVSSGTVTLSSAPSFAISSALSISSGTITLSSNPTVTLSSAPAFAISSALSISSGTITLSSNPTVIPSSAVQVTLTSNVVAISSGSVTLSSNPTVIASSVWTVTLSSNPTVIPSSIVSVMGDVANAATDSGNPQKVGGVYSSSNPTAVTSGQRVNAWFDKVGRQITVSSLRTLKSVQLTAISCSATETNITPASSGGLFLDLYGLVLSNLSTTNAQSVTIKDSSGGTSRLVFEVPLLDTRGFMVPVDAAVPQSASSQAWTATLSLSSGPFQVTALYVSNA